jgi:hypothetical protein
MKTKEEWKAQVREYVAGHRGTSFAEIDRWEGARGNSQIWIEEKNIVFWTGLDHHLVEAILEMKDSGELIFSPAHLLIYLCDGAMPQLPLVKRNRAYKTEHWLPVTMNLKTK